MGHSRTPTQNTAGEGFPADPIGGWSARGARFLTPPKQHPYEKRCYIRDPDGHLIEVGQTTDPEGDWSPPPLAIEHARRGVRVNARCCT
jgi:hypothetical protein